MTFEEKVKSMSGKQILQAMIDGLNKPWVEVDMSTYGKVKTKRYGFLNLRKKKVCLGCAATNTICEINNQVFPARSIISDRYKFLQADYDFLDNFEQALDYLRQGKIDSYNHFASHINIARLPAFKLGLPRLCDNNYKENLKYYQEYCDLIDDDM